MLDFAENEVEGVTAEIDEDGNRPGFAWDVTIVSNPTATLTFAANTGGEARDAYRQCQPSQCELYHDDDAENEVVYVTAASPAPSGTVTNEMQRVAFTIVDDETQTYVLALDTDAQRVPNPPKEGGPVMATIEAKPAHYDDAVRY